MAIAIGSIVQETNTFSPVPTRYADLAPVFDSAVIDRHAGRMTEMSGFLHELGRSRYEIAPLCAAWAITANRVAAADFDRLVGAFIGRLKRLRRPDAVLLALHGAQCAEGVDDVAGHLLAQARQVVGPRVPIVVTLDLHANVTTAIVSSATAIVGYHTYPHVDMFQTGVRAARLLRRILAGRVKPVMAWRKLPMIVPAENMQTSHGPFHRLVQCAKRMERSKAATAVSVFGVQPWLDVPEMGCSVVAVADGDGEAAETCASELAARFWKARREFSVRLLTAEEAIRRALAIRGGPVVISESSDSTGSGSPGDSTGLLRPLLAARVQEPCAAYLVDPDAVAAAARAGVGTTITLSIGGKFDRRHSTPVRVRAYVRLLSDGRWTPRGRGYNAGVEVAMGRSAVIEVGAARILMSERPAMTVDPELYRSHGMDPLGMKIVVVKSPNGFRAEYEPIAKAIFMVDTPGVSTPDLKALPYRRVPRPLYPLDARVRYSAASSRRLLAPPLGTGTGRSG